MGERKEIGKIQKLTVGYCGYDEAGIGVCFRLGGDGWGVRVDEWAWGREPSSGAAWTNEDDIMKLGEVWRKMKKWMDEAKVKEVHKLLNVPVEVTFVNNRLTEWRILTEVL